MKVEITVSEEALDKAFKDAEKELVRQWFDGDKPSYEDWAGDIVSEGFDILLDKLAEHFNVQFFADPHVAENSLNCTITNTDQ